ncbi:hypothetical protein QBC35DRAFT_1212 [Podospora australis]|uniref:Uncharacterized protein n=1 Tax=Podospora australis TaxID=1536484 RepID=A0AAN7ALY2_9PEZI|nr:hypothetical protein QBC35DRAFT_1212 [Podospora australis]
MSAVTRSILTCLGCLFGLSACPTVQVTRPCLLRIPSRTKQKYNHNYTVPPKPQQPSQPRSLPKYIKPYSIQSSVISFLLYLVSVVKIWYQN